MISDDLFKKIKKINNTIINLLFPIQCLDCGREGVWLCADCNKKLKFCREQTCLICKSKNKSGCFCDACKNNFHLTGILIAADYNNAIIANLIKNFKYHFAVEIADILGDFLFNFIRNNPTINDNIKNSILIPVPLHQKRLHWRSFNQAEKIAMILGERLHLPLLTDLVRIKNTKPQVKLNAEARKTNVKDCFAWAGNNLQGKNIFLIDDVTTTGSTLNECAKALKSAGADEIWGLVVANG
jgi:ComF family protein